MSDKQFIELMSMYLHQPVLGAHGIMLELQPTSPGNLFGRARLDPNSCTLDLWGDRGACTRIAFQDYEVEATRMDTVDPLGFRRVHWTLQFKGLEDATVNLIEHSDAGVRYLTVQDGDVVTAIVPLFDTAAFTPQAVQQATEGQAGGEQVGGENP